MVGLNSQLRIKTGARIRSSESDWWFEDVSYLSVPLFVRLMKMMEAKGIRPEKLTGTIIIPLLFSSFQILFLKNTKRFLDYGVLS